MKFFCIGHNKTGTTSLLYEFIEAGYSVAPQIEGEKLLDEYLSGNYEKIVDFCRQYDVFQDVPFSLRGTYAFLDKEFPQSKFILTVRDTSQIWYDSLIKFHSRVFGHTRVPNIDNLTLAKHIHQGWVWKYMKEIYKSDPENIYDEEKLIDYYELHNLEVLDYFRDKKNFLKINLSEKKDYLKFKNFTGIVNDKENFFHYNKSRF
jgi:hypothetical protein